MPRLHSAHLTTHAGPGSRCDWNFPIDQLTSAGGESLPPICQESAAQPCSTVWITHPRGIQPRSAAEQGRLAPLQAPTLLSERKIRRMCYEAD